MFNPEKASYVLNHAPTVWHRCKMFILEGFIVSIEREVDFTKMSIMVITFRNKEEVREIFDLYFIGNNRGIAERHAREGDLINAAGDLILSKESTDETKIIKLNVKDADLWKKYGTAYQQISELIKASETENDDLAF